MLEQYTKDSEVYLFESKKKDCLYWKGNAAVHYLDHVDAMEDALEDLEDEIAIRRRETGKGAGIQDQKKIVLVINEVEDLIEAADEKKCTELFQSASEAGIDIVFLGESNRLKGRDVLSKYVKSSVYGLVLGEQGMTEVFPVGRSREVPKRIEEGLLFRQGGYIRLMLPKWEQEE